MDTSVQIIVGKDHVKWTCDGHAIVAAMPDIQHALAYPDQRVVLLLTGKGRFPLSLIGFDMLDGAERFRVCAPEGYKFSHLVRHPRESPAVVCQGAAQVDNFWDWHFAVDPMSGELRRFAPAY